MTKIEFLEYLEKRLQILNKKEREDILGEYAQHIELKMANGLSEEEAIHDFGNLEELAVEILDAYNVNPDYKKGGISTAWKNIGKKCSLSSIKLFVKCGALLILLFIIYIPLAWLDLWIGEGLYGVFDYPLDGLAAGIVILGFHLGYLGMSVAVFYTFIRRNRNRENEESWLTSLIQSFKIFLALPVFKKKTWKIKHEKRDGHMIEKIGCVLKAGIILAVKIAVICCFAPVLLFQLFLVVIFGGMLVLTVLGYPLVGFTIALFGELLCGYAFFWLIGSVLFFKKGRKEA